MQFSWTGTFRPWGKSDCMLKVEHPTHQSSPSSPSRPVTVLKASSLRLCIAKLCNTLFDAENGALFNYVNAQLLQTQSPLNASAKTSACSEPRLAREYIFWGCTTWRHTYVCVMLVIYHFYSNMTNGKPPKMWALVWHALHLHWKSMPSLARQSIIM